MPEGLCSWSDSDQDEAFDVARKLNCIRVLIPLRLMYVHEVLEEKICTLAGVRYAQQTP